MTGRSHRRLRAPTADGAALIDPPLSEAARLIVHNRNCLADFDRVNGFSSDARTAARRTLLEAAACFEYQRTSNGGGDRPLVLSGHQPELFHPGVWLKNFVISSIAQTVGGSAINLVVDSDTIRVPAIQVPTQSVDVPQIISVPFDAAQEEMPWQLRQIADEHVFRNFAAEVHRVVGPIHRAFTPGGPLILDELWAYALDAIEVHKQWSRDSILETAQKLGQPLLEPPAWALKANLGECLAHARHRFERQRGLQTTQCPLKFFGLGNLFLLFADHLLLRHREFRTTYNNALADYRLTNHVRSQSHPVPDLDEEGEWYEAPFWVFTIHNPRRRRVFVRQLRNGWELTDREGIVFHPSKAVAANAHDLSVELLKRSIFLRPRAIITTMYARLVLSDLFIHGIGGAKYDEVTDEIIRRFFGIEPPRYITATATFRLPIERPQVTIEDVWEVRQKLRDVRYRPENLLRDPLTKQVPGLREQLKAMADEKREYVRTHDLRRCEEQVFARLDTINRAMHDLLRPVEQELQAQHSQLEVDLRRAELLGSREFSFVLFPADELPERLLALSKVSA